MTTLISPSITPAAPQAAASGTRGRSADQPEGRSFGAALERSRSAGAAGAQHGAETTAATETETAAPRKPGRAGEKKTELSAADVMAMLGPLPAPIAPAAAHGKLPAGTASKGAAAAPVDGLALDAAPAAALPKDASALADGAAPAAADPAAAKTAPAAAEATHGTHAAAPAADRAAGADLPAATTAAAAAPAPDAGLDAAALVPVPAAPARPAEVKAPAIAKAPAAAEAPVVSAAAPATAAPDAAAALAGAKAGVPAAQPETAAAEPAAEPGTPALPALQAAAAPAADRAAEAAKSTPVLTVAPEVGSSEWGPAIGRQMIRMNASGHQVAELNLNPAGLGPLKVTLTLGDNQAQAMFVSAHESVRKAVEAALPQLRSTLAEQGIQLGQASVGAETRQPNGGGAFAEQNPSRPQGQPDYPGSARADNAAAQPPAAPAATALRRATAGLDTFA